MLNKTTINQEKVIDIESLCNGKEKIEYTNIIFTNSLEFTNILNSKICIEFKNCIFLNTISILNCTNVSFSNCQAKEIHLKINDIEKRSSLLFDNLIAKKIVVSGSKTLDDIKNTIDICILSSSIKALIIKYASINQLYVRDYKGDQIIATNKVAIINLLIKEVNLTRTLSITNSRKLTEDYEESLLTVEITNSHLFHSSIINANKASILWSRLSMKLFMIDNFKKLNILQTYLEDSNIYNIDTDNTGNLEFLSNYFMNSFIHTKDDIVLRAATTTVSSNASKNRNITIFYPELWLEKKDQAQTLIAVGCNIGYRSKIYKDIEDNYTKNNAKRYIDAIESFIKVNQEGINYKGE